MKQVHGGNVFGMGEILDMSANINPLGLPERVREAVISSSSEWEKYPDPFCTELCEKLAEKLGISAENIVCGNGAADLIYRLVHKFKPKKAVILAPTFGEYPKALAEVGCDISRFYLSEADGFEVDDGFAEMLDSTVNMAILCSPNNPSGRLIRSQVLERSAEKCAELDIILVVDECFSGFAENAVNWRKTGNYIVLGAFTKLYAMAGLRLGYAVCGCTETAEKLRNSGQFWSVSAPAQAAGIAALDEDEYVRKTVRLIACERRYIAEKLTALGMKVYPSDANYLLFKGEAGLDDSLLREGIIIRNCGDYVGLSEGFYRTAVRTNAENQRFIEAVRRCVNG